MKQDQSGWHTRVSGEAAAQNILCRAAHGSFLRRLPGIAAHRTLSENPKQGQRAQPVIIRPHRYQVKERIICEAQARTGKLQ